jgi:hypothetical protein
MYLLNTFAMYLKDAGTLYAGTNTTASCPRKLPKLSVILMPYFCNSGLKLEAGRKVLVCVFMIVGYRGTLCAQHS